MRKATIILSIAITLVGGAMIFVSPVGWGKGRRPILQDVYSNGKLGRGWRHG